MISVSGDADGIVMIMFDAPGVSYNLLNNACMAELDSAVRKCAGDDAVKGVILASTKSSFIVGADIDELWRIRSIADAQALADNIQSVFRNLETCKKPFVAALNGTALGGGMELALACHRRIAVERPDAEFGLPEVTLGLLPGGGGSQRLPRLVGVEKSKTYLLEGKTVSSAVAFADGLVDELCPPGELLERAKAWLMTRPEPVSTWERSDFRLTADPRTPAGAAFFMQLGAAQRTKTWRSDPAREAILACIYESAASPLDVAQKLESRLFAGLVLSRNARNIIRTKYVHSKEARLSAVPAHEGTKVAVVGAGMMGAGIGTVCANAGYEVVLVDCDQASVDRGKAYSADVYKRLVERDQLTQKEADARLDRIVATTDIGSVAGCSVIVEAVFEDREIKAEIFRKVERAAPDALLATNTSTLPITGLAETLKRPERFIGLHFFSPVDRMPLLEIIPGEATSQETLTEALAFSRRIQKKPVVVQDHRGFFTSRVFSTYVREGLALLEEGVPPALIENGGKLAGMPVGPLTVVDEISAETMLVIQRQNEKDLGADYVRAPGDDVLTCLVDQLNRKGKKYGAGLYDYSSDGSKRLWPELGKYFPVTKPDASVEYVIDRLMAIQSVEAAKCLDEGVISSAADGDVASVLAWNYPIGEGGVFAFIDTVGIKAFVGRCDRFASDHGARFQPPELLRRMAETCDSFFEY